MRRPGANRRAIRGFGGVLGGIVYLLDYSEADTFTRATEASFVDPRPVANGGTGSYAWDFVRPYELTDPTESGNVVADPTDMSGAGWEEIESPGVAANTTTAPDGSLTADTITDDNTPGTAYELIQQTVTVVTSTEYRWQIWIKKDSDETRFPVFDLNTGVTGLPEVMINTATGEWTYRSGSASSVMVTETVSGWWLVTIIATTSATSAQIRVFPARGTVWGNAATAATGSVIVWGVSAVPTGSVGTGPWALSGESRIFSDGSVLIEGARTNVVEESQETGSQWVATATEDENASTAPDGSTTADEWVLSAATDATTGGLYQQADTPTLAAVAYAHSIYARDTNGGDGKIAVRVFNNSAKSTDATLLSTYTRPSNLLTGEVAAATIGAGNYGWAAGSPWPGEKTVDIWGVQVEAGAFASSPIRTAGAAATRNTEQLFWASMTAAQEAAIGRAGGWYIDIWPNWSSTEAHAADASVMTVGLGDLYLYASAASGSIFKLKVGTTTITNTGVAFAAGEQVRLHVTSVNGGAMSLRVENVTQATEQAAVTDTGTATTWVGSKLTIGNYGGGTTWPIDAVLGRPVAA